MELKLCNDKKFDVITGSLGQLVHGLLQTSSKMVCIQNAGWISSDNHFASVMSHLEIVLHAIFRYCVNHMNKEIRKHIIFHATLNGGKSMTVITVAQKNGATFLCKTVGTLHQRNPFLCLIPLSRYIALCHRTSPNSHSQKVTSPSFAYHFFPSQNILKLSDFTHHCTKMFFVRSITIFSSVNIFLLQTVRALFSGKIIHFSCFGLEVNWLITPTMGLNDITQLKIKNKTTGH